MRGDLTVPETLDACLEGIDTVFTAVSDAPSDVIDEMIAGFSPDRSTAQKVVDFVLGPFGWS